MLLLMVRFIHRVKKTIHRQHSSTDERYGDVRNVLLSMNPEATNYEEQLVSPRVNGNVADHPQAQSQSQNFLDLRQD